MSDRSSEVLYDAVVVGGGPAGATAAHELAKRGRRVVLLDKAGRVKPCGGAVPPQLLVDFDVPRSTLVAEIGSARMVSPKGHAVDIPVGDGFVGMVDRGRFDEWLRARAAGFGAERVTGRYERLTREGDGTAVVWYREGASRAGALRSVRARFVVGADGALSAVARQEIPGAARMRHVFAYHEIVERPDGAAAGAAYDDARCDVYYQGRLSPDFYAWVFPHGPLCSVGTGSLRQGFDMRGAVAALRETAGLAGVRTLKREGAPIPLTPLRRWDNGRDVIVTGDAAGLVAPASGEGIFYAMTGGRRAAEAVEEAIRAPSARARAAALAGARRRFTREHGAVFFVLDVMQRFWYSGDGRRERFVAICRDTDVQRLTFDAYMRKRLVRAKPLSHARIFVKNLAHLSGLAAT
ncbi:geranylgeranyl diphosphate reductase [Gemmatimonadetes bacterium T265]|nr:geranylgeranyl diphosphate reductase [Gemmatimonadetes bacterium T265]